MNQVIQLEVKAKQGIRLKRLGGVREKKRQELTLGFVAWSSVRINLVFKKV